MKKNLAEVPLTHIIEEISKVDEMLSKEFGTKRSDIEIETRYKNYNIKIIISYPNEEIRLGDVKI